MERSVATPIINDDLLEPRAPGSRPGDPAWNVALLFPRQGYWTEDEYLARVREGAKPAGEADPYRVTGVEGNEGAQPTDSEDTGDGDRTDD